MTKTLPKKVRNYLLIFSSLILLSAIPYFAGSGLDEPEPMGAYLNNNFPSTLPQGLPYQPAFPNITFDSPLTFNEVPNDDKIIVGQRDGKIFWFDKNPDVANKNSVLDLSEKVGVVWDGGFLGLALHPKFGTNGNNFFYVWYTTEDENSNDFPNSYTTQSCNSEEYWGNFLILARYEINPNTLVAQASSEQEMLKLRMYGTTHRGGGLLFGDDGFLYLTTGDQTAFKKSQDILNNLDGGVLRIDVDKNPEKSHPPVRTMPNDHGYSDEITGNGYWIPNDNPFLSPSGENFEEYYSMGHRNPHRMTKDRETGELYVGEIGGGRHEEINVIKKGKNFGWPLYEGFYKSTFCVSNLYNDMPHEQPLVAFPRDEANAIIGGFVYRGNEIPELRGKYICADYGRGEEIFLVDITTGEYEQYGNFTSTNIISFGEDKQGELYILKQGVSNLFKVTSKNTGFGNTPQLLSETGAFSNVEELTPAEGLVPYDLVESFWSDGAIKKRWMAIPNNGSHNTTAEKIGYSSESDWNFPIGSVLIKHFDLPIDERNPSKTKRLETRFSIKANDGNFYFVTYKWNDQQTDAVLLTSGLDESINIITENGSTETQTWSYPSTIDCVTCHNPTTGGVIGATARYLNKDYTYDQTGRTANQLVTLSHLGVLDQSISDADTNSILTSKSQNDPTASLDEKARSYLDLNCAYCHRPGTGNRGDFDLRLNLDLVQTGVLSASPYLPIGLPNEKIVSPGNVGSSILHHRMNSTESGISMPPIGKNKIDIEAVQLINDWIGQLDPDPCTDRIIMEKYNNAPGTSIANLKSFENYPDAPSVVTELTEFRIPVNAGNDYGTRVKGLLKAPETGTYYFWISGDDNVELNLSTDENEANKTRIAYHNNWTQDVQWNKYATQKSAAIDLVAGQNYYIEALMNERGGGDNLAVGWRKPSNGGGDVPFQVLPCTVFDFFNGAPVVHVEGVTLNQQELNLIAGNTESLIATVTPENADDTSIIWNSSNTDIVTVDTNGNVTAVAEGNATITVITNDGEFTATTLVSVNPQPIPVTGITLNTNAATINVGSTQRLIATISPSNADNTEVAWASSNTDVATVNQNGRVTTITEGEAIITATTNDGAFMAEATITVITPVSGITIDPENSTLSVGDRPFLTAEIVPANATDQSIIWTSSNTNVVTVNRNGRLTAVAEGEVIITATTNDGAYIAEATITAITPVSGITIDPEISTLSIGDRPFLTAEIVPANATDQSIIWTSNDTNIVTVNRNGRLTAVAEGEAIITATTSNNEYSATASITVSSPVNGVAINPNTLSLVVGETATLNAQVSPSNAINTSVTWFSSDTSIATVNANGNVTAIATGTVTITTTTTDGGFTANANITVVRPTVDATGVTLSPSNVDLNVGENTTLIAQVIPTLASNSSVTWNSSNADIASVDTNGNVTAIGAGAAIITATTNDGGFTAESTVTVITPIIHVTGISLNPQSLNLTIGDTSLLSAEVIPVDASNTSVTWTSSNSNIARVNANGKVTAIEEGETTITVTTNDGDFYAETTITVASDSVQGCTASGSITMKRYDNIPGINLNELFNAPNFPDEPSTIIELDNFEIPAYSTNNYGAWVSGYLCAPETGIYYFWISGDDHVRLNLSTDDQSINKTTIAFHNGHTNYRMWGRYESQKSVGIQLVQGETYYIEGYMKEGVGGDHLTVGWRKPSDGSGSEPSEIIPGDVLSPNQESSYEVPVSGVSIDRTYLSVIEGNSATLIEQISPSNAANQSVGWRSSNNNIVTVDANGIITGVSPGNAVITVITNDGGFTAQATVTVREENASDCTATGTITMRRYDNIGGISLNNLFVATNFPNSPSSTKELTSFEIPEHVADNYGAWVSGYLCAPETGTYYFWVAGDNHVQLNLSTDDDMENSTTIAYHEGHTNTRIWDKYESQKSVAIDLVQGKSYYIEAYLKELNGGDHLAVGWSKPSDNNSDVPSEIIPGNALSPNNTQYFPLQASLREFVEVSIINIYPNPTSEFITIETSANKKIRWLYIYDSIGKTVMTLPQSEFREGQQNHIINLAHLAQGIYTIRIVADDLLEYTEKIIVK